MNQTDSENGSNLNSPRERERGRETARLREKDNLSDSKSEIANPSQEKVFVY